MARVAKISSGRRGVHARAVTLPRAVLKVDFYYFGSSVPFVLTVQRNKRWQMRNQGGRGDEEIFEVEARQEILK